MKIADQRTPGGAAAAAGLVLASRFCSRKTALWPGALITAATLAVAGCSAGGGHTAAAAERLTLSGSVTNSAQVMTSQAASYQLLTLNDARDLTFNQLLGINNAGQIAGYFGSGNAGHPNKGYVLRPLYAQGDFGGENYPGARQTQITGLNDKGISVGFFSPQNGATPASDSNFGFWRQNGHYHEVSYPTRNNSKPPVNQLLGINDTGTAVGFYTDGAGDAHGYAYNISTKRFKLVTVPGATSLTAAAINNAGATAGFFTNAKGTVNAFLELHNGHISTIAVPGASMTQAFGLNDSGEVVGSYTTGSGKNAVTHGFTWAGGKFMTVNFPKASSTTINGVNDEGDIVGFYTDAKGNTDGLVGLP
jgi:probable HAF family extracellular repeat protein